MAACPPASVLWSTIRERCGKANSIQQQCVLQAVVLNTRPRQTYKETAGCSETARFCRFVALVPKNPLVPEIKSLAY